MENIHHKIIVCFWTGDNPMSFNREQSLRHLIITSGANILLINKNDVTDFILKEHPLHPAYQYLSNVHKADYLRTYFMHFHGGGYSDIKGTHGSWKSCFEMMSDPNNEHIYICGYPEIPGGVAAPEYVNNWNELIGNGCYICKPNTPLTKEWYESMIALLDTKLEDLKQHPATDPRDCKQRGTGYPIEWNEMLGRIFHRVCYKYKDHIDRSLPMCVLQNYL
jgi:hypothetical protein